VAVTEGCEPACSPSWFPHSVAPSRKRGNATTPDVVTASVEGQTAEDKGAGSAAGQVDASMAPGRQLRDGASVASFGRYVNWANPALPGSIWISSVPTPAREDDGRGRTVEIDPGTRQAALRAAPALPITRRRE
jgi:hypothetical protein